LSLPADDPAISDPIAPVTAAGSAPLALSRVAILVVSAYIAVQMLSDFASIKIGLIANWAVDMGTFVYPVTFTLRDVVHKLLGRRSARLLIVAAGAINLAMAGYLMWVVRVTPADAAAVAFAEAVAPVLGRIVIASIVAEIVSELIDTEVYHFVVTRLTRRFQWLRVLISNSVSVPIDSAIFAVGAFAWLKSWAEVWEIFAFNVVVKGIVTVLSVPLIYVVRERRGAGALDD